MAGTWRRRWGACRPRIGEPFGPWRQPLKVAATVNRICSPHHCDHCDTPAPLPGGTSPVNLTCTIPSRSSPPGPVRTWTCNFDAPWLRAALGSGATPSGGCIVIAGCSQHPFGAFCGVITEQQTSSRRTSLFMCQTGFGDYGFPAATCPSCLPRWGSSGPSSSAAMPGSRTETRSNASGTHTDVRPSSESSPDPVHTPPGCHP